MRWRFGPFEVDLLEHQLRRGQRVVPVTRKSFALLAALLARPGSLVSKAELFETVWAGTVVTDAALSRAIRELRVALGDDAANPTCIATVHGLGFRFIAPLLNEAPAAPPESAPYADWIVAREHELAALSRAAATARQGSCQMVFVSGEAGIGKTTLVESFVAAERARGELWVAQGRCIEQYGQREAYLPLREALEALSVQAGNDRLRDVLLRYAPAWLAQLPWLAHDADRKGPPSVQPSTTAQGMLRELAHALEMLAADRLVVLWLEDLHWSDYSTLDAISLLAGRSASAQLLVIGSYRPGDAHVSAAPLHAMVQRLVQRGQASELTPASLQPPAIGRYLRARLRTAPALAVDDLAQFIHGRTEGNPLFTVAVVDDLLQHDRLVETDTGWTLDCAVEELSTGLPSSLRMLVRRQIDQLDEPDRRLLEAAAVAGTDFSAAAVCAALETDTAEVEERCLRLATTGRFLRTLAPTAWPDGTETSGFGFLHALYWQGTYESIAPARRAEWQQRVGLREEQAWGPQCGQIATELAMRFEAARDWSRCLRYLRLAGDGALARCAYQECADLLHHALEVVPRLPAADRGRAELELLLPLGAALMAVQGYAAAEVEVVYRRALDLCRLDARPGELQRVLRGLWNVQLVRAQLDPARVAADELIVHAAAQGSVRAKFDAFAKQGQTSMHRGDFVAARAQLEHALSLPLAAEDATWLREAPRVAAYLGWVLWFTGDPKAAQSRGDEAVAIARRAGSAHSAAFALGFCGWLHAFQRDWNRTRALALEQQVLSEEHGLVYWHVWSETLLGLSDVHLGGQAAGCVRMAHAIDEFLAIGGEVGAAHFLDALAEAWLGLGELDRAGAALERAELLQRRNGNTYHAAEHLRLQGELADAKREPDAAVAFFEQAVALARQQQVLTLLERAEASLARLQPTPGG